MLFGFWFVPASAEPSFQPQLIKLLINFDPNNLPLHLPWIRIPDILNKDFLLLWPHTKSQASCFLSFVETWLDFKPSEENGISLEASSSVGSTHICGWTDTDHITYRPYLRKKNPFPFEVQHHLSQDAENSPFQQDVYIHFLICNPNVVRKGRWKSGGKHKIHWLSK